VHYRILCDGELIGTSELEQRDESQGVATGAFVPTAAYARVRPVFRLFVAARADGESEPDAAKLAAYEAARDRLQVAVTDADGKALVGAGVIVLDFGDEGATPGPDTCEVEVYFATPEKFARLAPVA
jgi:hypothetical protein